MFSFNLQTQQCPDPNTAQANKNCPSDLQEESAQNYWVLNLVCFPVHLEKSAADTHMNLLFIF